MRGSAGDGVKRQRQTGYTSQLVSDSYSTVKVVRVVSPRAIVEVVDKLFYLDTTIITKMADDAMELEDAPNINIGSLIGQKLTESIKNLDVLSMIRKMVDQIPQDEEQATVQEKLKEVIEKYNSMTDEEREEFSSKMKEALTSKIAVKLQDSDAFDMSGLEEAIQEAVRYQLMLIGGAIILFVILLVFFGYKLYKSIKDKQVKREEKKKAKQLKKKK